MDLRQQKNPPKNNGLTITVNQIKTSMFCSFQNRPMAESSL